ncbi:MAG: flavin reductase family protein [Pseudomonadota bacterium]
MKIDPNDLDFVLSHESLVSSVVPRPIAFVSTVGSDGVFNLAPYSFFSPLSVKPMFVGFNSSRKRSGKKKDTLINVEFCGDFALNLVTESLSEAMNKASTEYPIDVDEFKEVGLTPVKGDIIKSPMVKESPINMECRLVQLVEFGAFPRSTFFIIGEVLKIHVRDDVYTNNKIDFTKLKAIGRMGGDLYCRTTDIFEMERPKSPSS